MLWGMNVRHVPDGTVVKGEDGAEVAVSGRTIAVSQREIVVTQSVYEEIKRAKFAPAIANGDQE